MEVKNQDQYNQGLSRYKLLSATAGVGSIITTNIGTYVLISDIDKWEFIHAANVRIKAINEDNTCLPEDRYNSAKREISNEMGVELVDDKRFIEFLRRDKGLVNLLCLAAIPHLSLSEHNNVNLRDNPIIQQLKDRSVDKKADHFTIPATHFPKWFRNEKGLLKTYGEWKEEWVQSDKPIWLFAPPRDPKTPHASGRQVWAGPDKYIPEFTELTQLNLILICENGHLSDIPWSRFLRWKTETKGAGNGDVQLFTYEPCCDEPLLKWSENKNQSEGYGSVYLECLHCGHGGGSTPNKPKINLEGITNLKPFCAGHKPWETSLKTEEGSPFDKDCYDNNGGRTKMQIALVTGNNVYFANTFSSIYIPEERLTGLSKEMERVLRICEIRFQSTKGMIEKPEWAARKIDELLLAELSVQTEDRDRFIRELKDNFVNGVRTVMLDEAEDLHEQYRRQEYRVFTEDSKVSDNGLVFTEILISENLAPYFTSIKRVEDLKISSVQLDLTRVKPSERIIGSDGKVQVGKGKNIFSIPDDAVHILPAVENFGEGIFFELKQTALQAWVEKHESELALRIKNLLPNGGIFNGNALRQKILHNGGKLLLIHTFSHLVMRELEFSCGYPTASLKERLYIAPDMAGVLIFTAEGSEGSMGGLIWQAEKDRIEDLLQKAFERALDCSSDPLCWESDGQGVFNLNRAACFSCALVAETACEERNLGLDRQVLVDEEIGFFKDYFGGDTGGDDLGTTSWVK